MNYNPNMYYGAPMPAPVPPKKKGKGKKIAAGIAGALAFMVVVGALTGNDDKKPTTEAAKAPAATETAPAPVETPAAAPPAPAGPKTSFGKGVYVAGQDIAAGTYSTEGSSLCYWEKVKEKGSTSFDNILENANVDAADYLTVNHGEIVRVKGTCKFALEGA